jgi:hypothetical protein
MIMRLSQKSRTGTSHAGPHHHHDHKSHNPTVAYRCSGEVESIDQENATFIMRVTSAHGRARKWIGRQVTFSLKGCKLLDHSGLGLKSIGLNDHVTVRTKLPRDQKHDQALAVHRLDIDSMGGSDHRLLYVDDDISSSG